MTDAGDGRSRFVERHVAFGKGAACLLCLLALALAWRFTPLKDSVDFAAVIGWQQSLKGHPAALFWVIGAYLVGSLVLFPAMVLNLATIITFGPLLGNAYAMAGWLCSAAFGFGIARCLGRDLIEKLGRWRVPHLFHRATRHGFLTVLSMRILPVAPFTIVNLLIGASGIRFADFFLATTLGRIPGIVTLTLFGVQVESFLRRPDLTNSILLVLVMVLLPFAALWLGKRFVPKSPRRNRGES